jgi:tmRNA-binding protein
MDRLANKDKKINVKYNITEIFESGVKVNGKAP